MKPSDLQLKVPTQAQDGSSAGPPYLLQLKAGTHVQKTDKGRVVQTNRGPMMLVPLTNTLVPAGDSDSLLGVPCRPTSATLLPTIQAAIAPGAPVQGFCF